MLIHMTRTLNEAPSDVIYFSESSSFEYIDIEGSDIESNSSNSTAEDT